MQIQKFHQARDFLEQFEQNNHWQLICAIYIHEKNAQKWRNGPKTTRYVMNLRELNIGEKIKLGNFNLIVI